MKRNDREYDPKKILGVNSWDEKIKLSDHITLYSRKHVIDTIPCQVLEACFLVDKGKYFCCNLSLPERTILTDLILLQI